MYLCSVIVFILMFILFKLSLLFAFQFSTKTNNKPMGLFSGGLIFGRFFVHQILGLIFGWAYFRVGLFLGNYCKWPWICLLNLKNQSLFMCSIAEHSKKLGFGKKTAYRGICWLWHNYIKLIYPLRCKVSSFITWRHLLCNVMQF